MQLQGLQYFRLVYIAWTRITLENDDEECNPNDEKNDSIDFYWWTSVLFSAGFIPLVQSFFDNKISIVCKELLLKFLKNVLGGAPLCSLWGL